MELRLDILDVICTVNWQSVKTVFCGPVQY